MNKDQTRQHALRMALLSNALFSGISGVLLVLNPALVAAWLGVNTLTLLPIIGLGLVIFSVDLLHQATRQRLATWRALIACLGDFAWVASSLIMLAVIGDEFSLQGQLLIAVVAAIVLSFGLWQFSGIQKAHQLPLSAKHRHCVPVRVNVPQEQMWQVVSKIGDIQRYMPALKSSELLNNALPGVGAIRHCEDKTGNAWSEECVAFIEGQSFTVRFLTDAPNFPYPAKDMLGGWEVKALSAGQCEVSVWWELELNRPFLAPILLPLMAFQVDRDFPLVVQSMAVAALNGTHTGKVQKLSPLARLAPIPC
ncbi:MAG: SRPBCC family protein [Verrucomicrobiota bacterium]